MREGERAAADLQRSLGTQKVRFDAAHDDAYLNARAHSVAVQQIGVRAPQSRETFARPGTLWS
jgi:hypothetical protein